MRVRFPLSAPSANNSAAETDFYTVVVGGSSPSSRTLTTDSLAVSGRLSDTQEVEVQLFVGGPVKK